MYLAMSVLLLLITVACAVAARHMAIARRHAPVPWMVAAALLGPIPLALLAVLPARRNGYA